MSEHQQSLEQALESAVSRALRDNLAPLQRTADELQQAYADLVAACSSSRPSNALPAMLRAQTAASALAAGFSVLSNFVTVALNPRRHESEPAAAVEIAPESDRQIEAAEEPVSHSHVSEVEPETSEILIAGEPAASVDLNHEQTLVPDHAPAHVPIHIEPEHPAEAPEFDIANLPTNLQELHRRANRVAKVAMQDIKLLRPKDVRLGRENKDLCQRLRSDLDKARKEYDRRCHAILDHPIDYFHRWMVEILAEGDAEALGEYPYPSAVLRH